VSLVLQVLLVAAGGALGASARWGIRRGWNTLMARTTPRNILFELVPWPTLIAGVIACYGLGIVVTLLGAATQGPAFAVTLLLGVGLCGAMSPLAYIAVEMVDMIRRGTSVIAVGYMLCNIGSGMGALWLGLVTAA
jgi:CrcB protein